MKSTEKIFLVSLILLNVSFAQSLEVKWNKLYGGTDDEAGGSVIETKDHGYLVSGYTKSFGMGDTDTWLLKTDINGDTVWTKTFGGSTYDWNQPVIEVEGGYLQLVRCYSFGSGGSDAWIIKTDFNGDTIWTKLWGEYNNEWLCSVKQLDNGDLVFCGRTSSFGANGEDVWIVRSDSLGEVFWNKTYGNENTDNAANIEATEDGGFIIIGRTYPPDDLKSDIWLLKTNENGDTLWTKTYGGENTDYGVGVYPTSDGGYLLAGNTASFSENYDIWIIRTDEFGDTLWTKKLGGDSLDRVFSVKNFGDENYVITGVTYSYGNGNGDGWFVIVDKNGEHVISTTLGGESFDYIMDCVRAIDGDYVITGQTTDMDENAQLWLSKISYVIPVGVSNKNINQEFTLLQNYPNPFNPITTIKYALQSDKRLEAKKVKLVVYNLHGSEVKTLVNEQQKPGNYEVQFPDHSCETQNLTSGIYFYRLLTEDYVETKKMILIK